MLRNGVAPCCLDGSMKRGGSCRLRHSLEYLLGGGLVGAPWHLDHLHLTHSH